MLAFNDWKEIGLFFKDNIDKINSFVYGSSEEDIQLKINKLDMDDYPVLVGIIPSSDSTSKNLDERTYEDVLFFYVLMPIKDRTIDEEDIVRSDTQEAIQKIEHLIMDNYEEKPLFRRIHTNSIHYDPEYGIWNSTGWSVAFILENDYL